ncbi:MAG: PSD1 and planctomycete cytochrome C domain-containing protein [Bryobacteraceae bacterium]
MKTAACWHLLVGIGTALAQQAALPPAAQSKVEYKRDVAPILARCQGCHGAQQQLSGLRLDNRASVLAGGYAGPSVVPGKSAESKLIHMVAGTKPGVVMPPAGDKLKPEQISILRAWIDQGADWPVQAVQTANAANPAQSHWSFIAPKRPQPPAVKEASWVRNPIDTFIAARLEAEGLKPSPEADKRTLLRRLSFDLTGLPPTPQETAEFLNDKRADAYERLVDRLIASPHYGEKWARHWLDLGRYADSDGYEKDTARPHAWRYRHWLITALNRDMPFDEFTLETMAGDILPEASSEQKVATGFHRNTLTNREGGTDQEQFRFEQVLDRAATVGSVWLGLTINCAQCHDHKYDPIKQKDVYQMMAFFNSADEVLIDAPLPGEFGPHMRALPEYNRKRAALLAEYKIPELQAQWEKKLLETAANPGKSPEWDFSLGVVRVLMDKAYLMLELGPSGRTMRQNSTLTDHFLARYGDVVSKEKLKELGFVELRDKLNKVEADMPPFSQAPIIVQLPQPRKTNIAIRGDFREKGIEVAAAPPAFLPAPPAGSPPSRVTLAKWLTSSDNPLTARVTVNRMWQELFGRGIVRTSEDFGRQGEKPSHPELLDWLALEFREGGWSMKRMHKMIVESATYRQSSAMRPDLRERDPNNVLVARQARLRLPAESLRDSALAASGLLNTAVGGQSVRPPQPAGVADLGYSSSQKWVESTGVERYRRGLYVHYQRTTPYPQMANFDAPDSNLSCSRRQRSNTPLQALNLLNDPVFYEAAQALAARIVEEKQGGIAERINYAFEVSLARPASPREKDRLSGFFEKQRAVFERDLKAAETAMPVELNGTSRAEAATWTALARTILNLDEFMTRE